MITLARWGALAACACGFVWAQEAQKLAARALGDTPMFEDLRELCDGIGGRPTGSPACERAVEWAANKFRKAGLQNVKTESFSVPNLWLGVSAEASATAPENFPLRIAAAPFSPSTKGTLEARLIDLGEGTAEAFARAGDSVEGAIVLIRSQEMRTFDDLFAEYLRNAPLLDAAKKYRPGAVLLESTRPRGLLYRHPISLTSALFPVPAAILAREQSERLARLAMRGEVKVRLAIVNKIGGAYESKNVVAEIRGREKPDEVVLIGAHLDSWDLGTGAEDNGVNAAMVIDLARAFHELKPAPRRTVRFVLFTGEEQGMWGSAGYVQRHKAEIANHVAVVIFDTGSGRLSGFYLNGREELRKPVNDALSAVSGFGVMEHSADALDGTDNFDFAISGVPNLVGIQDPLPYLPDYHAESDTLDRVNRREQKVTESIAGALLWGLAESAERPAPRQTRAEVEKLLIDSKLDQQMKSFGQWDDFKAGRRGVF
jgi:carboxypeptidase Q